MDGPSGAAPAPAPSAPASAPAATPAAAPVDRGPPPRGHKWPDAPKATPVGQAPIPSQARTPQQRSTGEAPKPASPIAKPTPQKLEPGAKPETAPQRAARLEKLRTASGEEVEVDVAELLERHIASERRKVKVNGVEREYSIAEAFERLPLAEGAHSRFREAKEIETKAQQREAQLEAALKPLTDPKSALSVLTKIHGPERAQAMMEDALSAIYDRQKMPEADRRQLEQREAAERGLSEREQSVKRAEAELQQKQQAEAQQRHDAARDTEIARLKRDFPILLKEAGLPTTPRMMARLAQAASEARALKIPYTEKQLAAQVAAEYKAELAHYAESAEPEQLRETLGKGADKLRQAEVDRVMKQPGRGRPTIAKPSKIPSTIRNNDQLRKFLREQDLAAERRGR